MKDLPTYNPENWTFVEGVDTGYATTPVFTDEGICELGRYTNHIYTNHELDTAKKYKVYIYTNILGTVNIGTSNDDATQRHLVILNQANGGIIGVNKATVTYENGKWYVSYNDNTKVVLGTEDYLSLVTSKSTTQQNKLLAITEEDETEEEE